MKTRTGLNLGDENLSGSGNDAGRNRKKGLWSYIWKVLLLLVLFEVSTMIYILDETEMGVIKARGNAVRTEPYAGPHFKKPWPIESVEKLSKQLRKYDAQPREIITGDKKTLVVDLFAYYRIVDGVKYVQGLRTPENANIRVEDAAYSEVRNIMGSKELHAIITTEREKVADDVQTNSNTTFKNMGLEAAAVQISKTELPEANKKAVYERMKSERGQIATKFRSEGDEEATKIRAAADKEARKIKAEAFNTAEQTKGEGEQEATRIYAAAYSRDPEFFKFWKSIQTANKSLNSGGTIDFYYKSGDVPFLDFMKK